MQLPEIGNTVELHYPTCTSVLAATEKRWKRREIQVQQIRDLVEHPLTLEEFLRRPFIYRSRYLLQAVEHGQRKQFYLGTAREFFSCGQLRLGLYLPDGRRPTELLSRPFENTPYDRRLLYRAVLELAQYDFGQKQLRVLADDLRIF